MSTVYLASVPSYWFTQMGVLAFGFAAILMTENVDALLMFLVTLTLSIINDIMLISIYQPRADDFFNTKQVLSNVKDEYRWALGMSIVNTIVKPVSIFMVYFIYQSRVNQTEFNINIPGLSSMGGGQSSSSQPGHGPYNTIESAQDSNPGVYGTQSYPYQSEPPSAPAHDPNQPIRA